MLQYKNLLDHVSAISKRYEKINELTGENFNVFRILKLESSEVRMHSAFLAELLNPNGSHGQKDVFLKLFIDAFCFKGNNIDTASCRVDVEKHVGFLNEHKTEGGRIDMVITDKHHNHILIENKIYAGDQINQLGRYHEYSSNADLIYLTLDGKSPTKISKGESLNDEHYRCISYEKHILEWLELCRKEVTVYPVIREAITHYINLIKHLTNQAINNNMEEEISDLLKNYIEESFTISANLDRACQKVADDFFSGLVSDFKEMGYESSADVNFSERYGGIYVWKSGWKNISAAFSFQNYDKEFRYGFLEEDPEKFTISAILRNSLNKLPNNSLKNSDWWPWYRK